MTLLLFSSNMRPQYEVDIINSVALPKGQFYRFRYEEKYVEAQLRDSWAGNELVGTPALIVYSIQQPAGYHPPAYVPVRWAKVIRSWVRGSVFVIQFAADEYPDIGTAKTRDECRTSVQCIYKRIEGAVSGSPAQNDLTRQYSAVMANDSLIIGKTPNDDVGFQRVSCHLTYTSSFIEQPFWRVSRVGLPGSRDSIPIGDDGVFFVEPGRVYELTISHYRPIELQNLHRFEVTADDRSISLVGHPSFTIASRYDDIPIRFLTRENIPRALESLIRIAPASDGLNGPQVDIPFLVASLDILGTQ